MRNEITRKIVVPLATAAVAVGVASGVAATPAYADEGVDNGDQGDAKRTVEEGSTPAPQTKQEAAEQLDAAKADAADAKADLDDAVAAENAAQNAVDEKLAE